MTKQNWSLNVDDSGAMQMALLYKGQRVIVLSQSGKVSLRNNNNPTRDGYFFTPNSNVYTSRWWHEFEIKSPQTDINTKTLEELERLKGEIEKAIYKIKGD